MGNRGRQPVDYCRGKSVRILHVQTACETCTDCTPMLRFIICCCLPTLRRFFRHVAPRFIGENSESSNKNTSGRNGGLRTWGSTGPKRQYDTLMHTVDGGETDDELPLSRMRPKEGLQTRETTVQCGDRELRADNDSEEAILYERTVQITYEGGEETPAQPHTNKA
jgi:hypothetical protein